MSDFLQQFNELNSFYKNAHIRHLYDKNRKILRRSTEGEERPQSARQGVVKKHQQLTTSGVLLSPEACPVRNRAGFPLGFPFHRFA